MRKIILLTAFAFSAGIAWSQPGAHAGAGRAAGLSGSMSARATGSHLGSTHAPLSTSRNLANTPNHPSHVTSLDTQGNWTSSGFVPSQNGSGSKYNHDHRGSSNYGYGPVGYPIFAYPAGYLNGGLNIDDNDANDPNQAAPVANNYADNTPPGPGEQPYPAYYGQQDTARAPYDSRGYGSVPSFPNSSSSRTSASISDGLGHPKVTLIFKDGRTPLMIQNYAMSQTKVFVRDNGTDRDIAINDLDVPATMAANDQAGVDFELPIARPVAR